MRQNEIDDAVLRVQHPLPDDDKHHLGNHPWQYKKRARDAFPPEISVDHCRGKQTDKIGGAYPEYHIDQGGLHDRQKVRPGKELCIIREADIFSVSDCQQLSIGQCQEKSLPDWYQPEDDDNDDCRQDERIGSELRLPSISQNSPPCPSRSHFNQDFD